MNIFERIAEEPEGKCRLLAVSPRGDQASVRLFARTGNEWINMGLMYFPRRVYTPDIEYEAPREPWGSGLQDGDWEYQVVLGGTEGETLAETMTWFLLFLGHPIGKLMLEGFSWVHVYENYLPDNGSDYVSIWCRGRLKHERCELVEGVNHEKAS